MTTDATRTLLRSMATHCDNRCQNPNEPYDERILLADRAAAITWALKTETGQLEPTTDNHHQVLVDWEGDLVEAMTRPVIRYSRDRLAEVTRRADAIRWAAKLLEPTATVQIGAA